MNKELTLADKYKQYRVFREACYNVIVHGYGERDEYNAISFMRWLLLDDSKQDKLVGLAIRNEE